MDGHLINRLNSVARRICLYRVSWSLTFLWTVGIFLAASMLLGPAKSLPILPQTLMIGLAFIAAGLIAAFYLRRPSVDIIARRIESRFPALNDKLITAVDICTRSPQQERGYLQRSVVSEAIRHDIAQSWFTLVPQGRMYTAVLSNIVSFALLAVVIAFMIMNPPTVPKSLAALPDSGGGSKEVKVVPGDTEVERGTSLVVTANFPGELPNQASLVFRDIDSENETTVSMKQSLSDPVFAGYLSDLQTSKLYRVEYDDATTEAFRITVFEYPNLIRADAILEFPAYAKQTNRTVLDTRRVSVAKGTKLTWKFYLNKEVASAALVDEEENITECTINPETKNEATFSTTVEQSKTWMLRLVDLDGRENQFDLAFKANAIANKPAKLKLLVGGDLTVTPLQELDIQVETSDDFAVERAGITYQMTGGSEQEIAREFSDSDSKSEVFSELINFEQLEAEPYSLLSYFAWAEDTDESGEIRREVSDIFFVDVKPFEEIFRDGNEQTQGQSQQQQQQQQAGMETQELIEVQRQIVSATWNILRQTKKTTIAPDRQTDIELLGTSQRENLVRLEEKAAEMSGENIEPTVAKISASMTLAADKFGVASADLKKSSLADAMNAAQAALQNLLQLQSEEKQVSQSQSGQPGQGRQSNARQQQLDELELNSEQDRYEEQRLATEQQNDEQADLRQTINRLRELAARQEDLNQQLRELETALQLAETQTEKNELQERLKRLREQQQELLQDGDELQERMADQSSESMQQAEQAMQEARENLQKSNEALRQEDLNTALASGTRAEQQLEELQESVRQQAANQFAETLDGMKNSAETLLDRQEEITQKIATEQTTNSPGLRAESNNQGLAEQLAAQQQQLNELLEKMQETIEQSEEAEPLLAQKLYDAFRKAKQEQAEERLNVTKQLVEQDFTDEASELSSASEKDLASLQQDIEEAAEAVLGSEIDSLRLALEQLDRINEAVDQELQAATGSLPGRESENRSGTEQANSAQSAGSDSQSSNSAPAGSESSAPQSEQRGEPQAAGEQAGERPSGVQPEQSQTEQSRAGQPQPGQATPGQAQSAQGQPSGEGSGPGQPSPSQSSGSQPSESQSPQGGSDSPRNGPGQASASGISTPGSGVLDAFSAAPGANPLTGTGFSDWSDRLRDVEELVTDPELRWQAAQIRQAARAIRSEYNKHAEEPKWSEVEDLIVTPLKTLRREVSGELIRRAAKKTEIVPIDRDPVPDQFSNSVQKYYENLGSSQ